MSEFRISEDDYTPEPNTGCWLWLRTIGGGGRRTRARNGYAQTNFGLSRGAVVTRLILGLTPGDGFFACHRCDNPPCVNPAHLFVGTPRDNNHDMQIKGRLVIHNRGIKACKRGHPLVDGDVYVNPAGRRECRACARIRTAQYRADGRR